MKEILRSYHSIEIQIFHRKRGVLLGKWLGEMLEMCLPETETGEMAETRFETW
eukprot:c42840_g1_i1 orf=3-158(-)